VAGPGGKTCRHGHRHHRQSPGLHGADSPESNHVLHRSSSPP